MNDTAREAAGYGLPIAWITVLLVLSGRLGPVARFVGATAGLLLSIKVGAWLVVSARSREYSLSGLQWLLYWTVWPGVRPDLFAGSGEGDGSGRRGGVAEDAGSGGDAGSGDGVGSAVGAASGEGADPDGRTFLRGYAFVLAGVALALLSVLALPVVGAGVSSWLLLFAVLSSVHLGVGRLLPFGLRWLGYPVPGLFRDPLASRGVGEFWSDRWNRPFVGMNRLFVTRPLSGRVGVGMGTAAAVAFLVSGALHELAISYTAGAGWGGPFLYFVLQGVLYTVERRWIPDPDPDQDPGPDSDPDPDVDGWHPVVRRLWTYAAVLVPLPLLFHAPFRTTFLVPLVEAGRAALLSYPPSAYVGAGLWVGAAGHFLVLVASSRVPAELDWEDDLASLRPLNRKLMWTYGGFVVLMIVSFGVLTALFRAQFLAGTPVALGVCGLIAVFWTARILVDFLYFSHEDWPDGVEFVVGHATLTSLFVVLVAVYAGTIAFHLL